MRWQCYNTQQQFLWGEDTGACYVLKCRQTLALHCVSTALTRRCCHTAKQVWRSPLVWIRNGPAAQNLHTNKTGEPRLGTMSLPVFRHLNSTHCPGDSTIKNPPGSQPWSQTKKQTNKHICHNVWLTIKTVLIEKRTQTLENNVEINCSPCQINILFKFFNRPWPSEQLILTIEKTESLF